MIDKINNSIITMFGVGYFKYAPGTLASFLTIIIYYYATTYLLDDWKYFEFELIFLLILFIYSVISIDEHIKTKKNKDPNQIVIDEFFGQLIPLYAGWFYSELNFYIFYIASFALFRFFDIVKPFPINIVDKKMKNGLGVMLDDIIAGIYTTIVIYTIYTLWF